MQDKSVTHGQTDGRQSYRRCAIQHSCSVSIIAWFNKGFKRFC